MPKPAKDRALHEGDTPQFYKFRKFQILSIFKIISVFRAEVLGYWGGEYPRGLLTNSPPDSGFDPVVIN